MSQFSSQPEAERKPEALDTRIVEGLGDCATLLDLGGRILYANAAGKRLLGSTGASQPDCQPFSQIFSRDDRAAVDAALAAAARGESSQCTAPVPSAGGGKQWWEISAHPVLDSGGAVSHVLVISRDITAQQQSAQFRELERSMLENMTSGSRLEEALEGLVSLIQQFSDDALCCVLLLGEDDATVQHTIAPDFSDAYASAVLGLPVGPRVGSCGTAMFRRSRVIVKDIFSDPLWDGFDEIKVLSGGRACWSTPILSDNGKVVGSFAIYAREAREPTSDELELMDLAAHFARVAIDKHQAQQGLRKSEARNRAMLRALPDFVFLTTQKGRIVDYHLPDLATAPLAPADCLDRNIRDVIPNPLGVELGSAIKRVNERGVQENFSTSLEASDGTHFFNASLVKYGASKVLSIVRDVTEQRRVELQAAAQREELTHLGRVAALGEITATLAHELSQPLAIMRTNADVARKVLGSDELRVELLQEIIDEIVSSNRRAGDIIDRLRALLRKEQPNLEPVDLHEAARETISLMKSEILSRHISVSCSGAAPAILGDRVQLQQVLLNLVLNACDAMAERPEPDRQLVIGIRAEGDFVELSVSDSGTGIPENQLEDIFHPFVSHGKDGRGMGLGLSISRSIVTAHQGTLHAENNPDGGATFRCRFPLAVATENHPAPGPLQPEASAVQ